VLVYGPADHGRSEEFLQELVLFVSSSQHPVVVGGDFNLIRGVGDKSNGNINWPRVHRFNEALAAMSLREVCRVGARFTWTNHQLGPIRCVLDMVFVSPGWEMLSLLCPLTTITHALGLIMTRFFCAVERAPLAYHPDSFPDLVVQGQWLWGARYDQACCFLGRRRAF
jgi:hypothetical protein